MKKDEERGALVSTILCATMGVCFVDRAQTNMPTSVAVSGYAG